MKKDSPREELAELVDLTLRYIGQEENSLPLESSSKISDDISQPVAGEVDAVKEMGLIDSSVLACEKCPLHRTRTHAVPGEGNIKAGLVFIGEAPGGKEDKQGRPFVGRSGELLTKIITRGMGMTREEIYITNIVKCRPPGNRDPLPGEIASCQPYLVRQLEIIRPKVICTLGRFAAQCLLNTKAPLSRLRGKLSDYNGIPLIPTYHPAYLLRNYTKEARRQVWDDVKKVAEILKS